MRRGFSFLELFVVILILGIILALGFVKYRLWLKKVNVERDTRLIYSVISKERMRAISESKSFRITAVDDELVVEDLSSGTKKVIPLNDPFSGTIDIYPKGVMSRDSIVFLGDLNLNPDVSCVVSDSLRLRMGRTYIDSRGKRKCR